MVISHQGGKTPNTSVQCFKIYRQNIVIILSLCPLTFENMSVSLVPNFNFLMIFSCKLRFWSETGVSLEVIPLADSYDFHNNFTMKENLGGSLLCKAKKRMSILGSDRSIWKAKRNTSLKVDLWLLMAWRNNPFSLRSTEIWVLFSCIKPRNIWNFTVGTLVLY